MAARENALQTLQRIVQDVLAPDVRELKVRVASLEKQVDVRFDAMDQKLVALNQKIDSQFSALMAAIRESRAEGELAGVKAIAALSERVAVLESRIQ